VRKEKLFSFRDGRLLLGCIMVVFVLTVAFAGPLLAPFDPLEFVARPFLEPTADHWLGTDILGRDVLSNLLAGGQLFIIEATAAALIGVGAGLVLGVTLALLPGKVSEVTLSISDTLLLLPQIVIALLVLTRLGSTPLTLIAVTGVVHIPQSARVIRAASQRVVRSDYFYSARLIGVSKVRLFMGEILPNIAAPLAVEFSVRLAISSVVLASLSYLGFGSTGIEWGRMIHDNQGALSIQPWGTLAPVIAIGVFLIGVHVLREGFTRALHRVQ
jgi:peptide/nickel transport system permease protein